MSLKTTVDPDFDFHNVEEFYKIYVFFKEGEEEEKEIEHMTHKLIRYGDGCVLYEPMEKALGIRNMLDYFGMKPNQAVVFGADIMICLCLDQNGLILPWGMHVLN